MIIRALFVVAAIAAVGNGPLLAQKSVNPVAGSAVIIHMTGKLAEEYAKRTGMLRADRVPPGLEISTSAVIAQKLNDGRLRIEHTSHINRKQRPVRLVTFQAIIEASRLTMQVWPEGTIVSTSPRQHRAGTSKTASPRSATILHLSNLKDLKLQSWTLVEEVGN